MDRGPPTASPNETGISIGGALSEFFLQQLYQFFPTWQLQLVAGDEERVIHAGEGVFHEGVVLTRTKQQAHGRIVALGHLVLAVPVDVGVELPQVLVLELIDLQLDQDVALEDTVVE